MSETNRRSMTPDEFLERVIALSRKEMPSLLVVCDALAVDPAETAELGRSLAETHALREGLAAYESAQDGMDNWRRIMSARIDDFEKRFGEDHDLTDSLMNVEISSAKDRRALMFDDPETLLEIDMKYRTLAREWRRVSDEGVAHG